MSDITKLKNIINPKVIIPIKPSHTIELHENANITSGQTRNYIITISNVPEESLIIKCDSFPCLSSFISEKGMNCRADYAILHIKDSKPIISIIEITSSKNKKAKSSSQITNQLLGAKSVIEYCKTLLINFKSESILNNPNYSFVTIYGLGRGTQKQPVYPNITGDIGKKPDTPIEYLKPSSDALRFEMLFNSTVFSKKNRKFKKK